MYRNFEISYFGSKVLPFWFTKYNVRHKKYLSSVRAKLNPICCVNQCIDESDRSHELKWASSKCNTQETVIQINVKGLDENANGLFLGDPKKG